MKKQTSSSKKIIAIFALFLAAFTWGSAFCVLKDTLENVSPIWLLAIDKPEQIEVYKQALKVLDEVKKLGDMADKYKCSAFGARGILTILPNDEMVIVPGNVVDCHPDGLWMRAR